jgi:oligopeptide/dipeptide ABC transporter ATP-binding protein
LSGGQAQRVVIAMALLNCPKLVVADEATTGLDVTVQSEVLDLLIEKTRNANASLLLITHDLGVVANYTDTTTAMFAGEVIESGPTKSIFSRPAHPYMAGLLRAADLGANPSGSAAPSGSGPPPNLAARPDGCQFGYRCGLRRDTCAAPVPLRAIAGLHQARCVRAEELETRKVG